MATKANPEKANPESDNTYTLPKLTAAKLFEAKNLELGATAAAQAAIGVAQQAQAAFANELRIALARLGLPEDAQVQWDYMKGELRLVDEADGRP